MDARIAYNHGALITYNHRAHFFADVYLCNNLVDFVKISIFLL